MTLLLPKTKPFTKAMTRPFARSIGGPASTTWNPEDTSYSLANGNRYAGPGGSWALTRAVHFKDAGKHSFDVEMTGVNASFTKTLVIGLAKATANFYSYLGSDTEGVGFYLDAGNKVYGGAQTPFAAPSVSQGDIFTLHCDLDAGTIIYELNGAEIGTMTSPIAGVMVTPATSLYSGAAGVTLLAGPVSSPRSGYADGWYTT